MIIRNAEIIDKRGLSELFDAYRQFYKQTADIEGAESFINERLKNNDSTIFVAESDGELAGFTQLYPSFSSVSMKRLWVLNDLFVAANERKKGVAKQLMNHANEFAQKTSSKGIALETDWDNIYAQKLYEQLGYQKVDSTYHYFLATNTHE